MANETGAVIKRNATRDIVSVTVPDLSGIYATQTDLGDVEAVAVEKATVYSLPSSTPPTPPSGGFVIGDLWFKTDLQNEVYVWDGDSWVSMRDLAIIDAQNTADGKAAVFVQSTTPTAFNVNDVWVDTGNGNILKIWDGTAWVPKQDADIATALSNASDAITAAATAQATADGKVTTFFQTSAPTAEGVGDLWIDTDNGNALSRWSGSAWVAVQDAGIAQAIADAADAQSTADGKIVSFYQTSAPTATSIGDLWIDTDDSNHLYRWSGSAWVTVRDSTIAAAQADASQALADAATAQNAADLAQATADGKIVTYYQSTAPATHALGDLWIDSDDKKLYRWDGTSWVDSQDTAIGTALSDAANAQATADGKITTFYTTAAPTAEGVGDLWVDTDDGNHLYRWSGSAWTSVRDGTIADAQTAADAAQADATQAITDAAGAQATADGKVTTFFQTSPPTAEGVGDLWLDTDDGNKLYRWSGSAWVSVQDADIAQAITDAATAQATADSKIVTFYQTSSPTAGTVGDLWVDTDDSNKLYRWSGSAWVSIRDATIAVAQSTANSALTTANGRNAIFFQTTAPTATKVNDLWFDTDDGNKPYKWDGSAWVAATFGDSAIAGLNVGKLVSGEIAVGESIVAGPSSGTHAEMSDTGFYAYVEDPDGGAPNEAIRIGTDTGDLLSVPDPATGATLGSINQEGIGSLQGLSITGTDDDGDGVPDSGFTIYGTEFSDWTNGKSGGTLAQGIYTSDHTSGPITTEFGIAELSYFVDPNRSYIFIFPGVYWSWQGTKSSAVFSLRYTTDGSTPSITSTLWDTVNCIGDDTENHWYSSYPMILEGGWNVSEGVPVRILVTVRRGYGVGTVKWGIDSAGSSFPRKYPRLILLDSGLQTPETWIGNDGGGTGAPTKQNYIKTYQSTSSATYQGDGSKRTDTSDVVQGYNSFNGDGKGLWIFPSMTSDLSGSTVTKVQVYAYANHWYYNSGGSALIKVHGYTSAPASSPSMTTAITWPNWPKPGGRWVTLPSSLYAGFKAGTYRGFGMGPSGGTNLLYYGRFNGGTGALIRVYYTK